MLDATTAKMIRNQRVSYTRFWRWDPQWPLIKASLGVPIIAQPISAQPFVKSFTIFATPSFDPRYQLVRKAHPAPACKFGLRKIEIKNRDKKQSLFLF
jgi:hypothetical protein